MRSDLPAAFAVRLPPWLADRLARDPPGPLTDPGDRMRFVIGLSRRNLDEGTGGPFGAAVFARETGALVAAGVNVVEPSGVAAAHAEVAALALAQVRAGGFDLGAACGPVELVCSAEPCGMCTGMIHWSGVAAVTCGARSEDVRAAGFDEGPAPPGGVRALESRGVAVVRDLLRGEAAAVLRDFARGGGAGYNAAG